MKPWPMAVRGRRSRGASRSCRRVPARCASMGRAWAGGTWMPALRAPRRCRPLSLQVAPGSGSFAAPAPARRQCRVNEDGRITRARRAGTDPAVGAGDGGVRAAVVRHLDVGDCIGVRIPRRARQCRDMARRRPARPRSRTSSARSTAAISATSSSSLCAMAHAARAQPRRAAASDSMIRRNARRSHWCSARAGPVATRSPRVPHCARPSSAGHAGDRRRRPRMHPLPPLYPPRLTARFCEDMVC